jgi:hypothetical protein
VDATWSPAVPADIPLSDAALFAPVSESTKLLADRSKVFQSDFLWNALDEGNDLSGSSGLSPEGNAVVVTGLLASAGYVLLNTRAGFWLLSLLTSKPLWKEFDPLEILYAWEKESAAAGGDDKDEDEETLVSLVS